MKWDKLDRWIWIVSYAVAIAFIFWLQEQLLAFFILLASLFVIRLAVVRKVSRMMYARSEELPSDALSELESPEVPSTTALAFVESDASSLIEPVIEYREALVAQARARFRRALLRDAVAAGGYIVIPLLLIPIGGEFGAMAGVLVGIVLLALVVLRFLFYFRQFRPQDIRFEGFFVYHPFFVIYRELSRPRYQMVIIGLIIAYFVELEIVDGVLSAILTGLVLLLAVGFHLFLIRRWVPKTSNNTKLLILRVFGVNENALFTFGRLVRFWQHVGSYFTVVDPSFLQHQYRLLSSRSVEVMLLLAAMAWLFNEGAQELALVLNLGELSFSFYLYGFIPFAAVAALLLVALEYRRIDRSFVGSREDLQARLRRLEHWPWRLDLTFRGMPTMCYADTWQMAVSEFVKKSDAVLMDLRGFSEERKGCEYEVDFLLDNISVDRILFLVDSAGDHDLVRRLILDRWEHLRVHSPNLELETPKARIYVSAEQNERDVQGILDYLIGAAVSGGAQAALES